MQVDYREERVKCVLYLTRNFTAQQRFELLQTLSDDLIKMQHIGYSFTVKMGYFINHLIVYKHYDLLNIVLSSFEVPENLSLKQRIAFFQLMEQ